MKSGIYKILNKINGKAYVGSAVNLNLRWSQHKSKLKINEHPNKYLQASWNKNGLENFEFVVIEYCDKSILLEREQFWIDNLKVCDREFGYNTRIVASSNIGIKLSEETKKLLSEKNKGKKRTAETKAKMSAWQIGRKMSKEAKLNMAQSTRDFEKWPCEDGAFCKCRSCKDKRNALYYQYAKNKKFEKGKIIASDYILGAML